MSTKITRKMRFQGKRYIVIEQEHWDLFLSMAFPDSAEARGGCQGWCEDECSGEGGCSRSFGSPGSCGAICGSGNVYIEI